MYLQISIKDLTCEQASDNPLNPFDHRMELYQTWQLMAVEQLGANSPTQWARQGFSLCGAPKKGLSIKKGEKREPFDPKITFTLPSDFPSNTTLAYRIFVHHFESDRSSEKVRGIFTDDTLKFAVKAWEAAQEDENKAKKDILEYIEKNPELIKNGIQNFLTIAGLGNAPWIPAAFDMIPLLKLIAKLLGKNSDDYINSNDLIFEFRREGNTYKWRFNTPEADINPWKSGEGQQLLPILVENGKGNISFTANYQCRILD